jgi:hypothetical protein
LNEIAALSKTNLQSVINAKELCVLHEAKLRPLVERLIICEPRHNRLINSNPTKGDEADVEGMCLLLRLGKLKRGGPLTA